MERDELLERLLELEGKGALSSADWMLICQALKGPALKDDLEVLALLVVYFNFGARQFVPQDPVEMNRTEYVVLIGPYTQPVLVEILRGLGSVEVRICKK